MRTKSRRLLKGLKPIQTKIDDLNYYLGISVGEHIVHNFLPTLSTDSLKTFNLIEVSDEETQIWNEMYDKWYSLAMIKYDDDNDEESTKVFYENLKWYLKLEEKYLPETINIRITKVKPTNIVEFQRGIEEALWDCDLSHYSVVDGFFEEGHEYAWCSTITLTRYLGTIPEKYL
jgi:hypothetical protein